MSKTFQSFLIGAFPRAFMILASVCYLSRYNSSYILNVLLKIYLCMYKQCMHMRALCVCHVEGCIGIEDLCW